MARPRRCRTTNRQSFRTFASPVKGDKSGAFQTRGEATAYFSHISPAARGQRRPRETLASGVTGLLSSSGARPARSEVGQHEGRHARSQRCRESPTSRPAATRSPASAACGLPAVQAPEIVRGCAGLNLVGGGLVEVPPPYESSGKTALTGANLLYEMLCVRPGARRGGQQGGNREEAR